MDEEPPSGGGAPHERASHAPRARNPPEPPLAIAARFSYRETVDYTKIITIEPGKRGGKPCIRGMRITVYDVLEYLAAGMTHEEILKDFPYLTEDDIRACLAFAADGERRLSILSA